MSYEYPVVEVQFVITSTQPYAQSSAVRTSILPRVTRASSYFRTLPFSPSIPPGDQTAVEKALSDERPTATKLLSVDHKVERGPGAARWIRLGAGQE